MIFALEYVDAEGDFRVVHVSEKGKELDYVPVVSMMHTDPDSRTVLLSMVETETPLEEVFPTARGMEGFLYQGIGTVTMKDLLAHEIVGEFAEDWPQFYKDLRKMYEARQ